MKKGTIEAKNYWISQKSKLLKTFNMVAKKMMRKTLVSKYGPERTDTIIEKARQEFEALIPKIPYIYQKNFILKKILIQCAATLAIYKVLKTYGKTAEEIGEILNESYAAYLGSFPGFIRRLIGRLFFARFFVNRFKKFAVESQKRLYPGDWVFSVVEGDGKEFDVGYDYTECAVCKFFHAEGADEIVPYMCAMDISMSKSFGWGMVRTTTIAVGGEKCDFRYKKGRPTKPWWPRSRKLAAEPELAQV